MSKHSGYGQTHRVNILKKANVAGKWSLFPAVVEPNGNLKDKVRIKGKIEVHTEGTYYVEWWQGGHPRAWSLPVECEQLLAQGEVLQNQVFRQSKAASCPAQKMTNQCDHRLKSY